MGATVVEPGEETTVLVDFPMGMHSGMDGPHLFRITVPVTGADGVTEDLVLHLEADFG